MSGNVMFRYSSPTNITFHGLIDSGYTPEEWNELSEDDQNIAMEEAVWDQLIEIFPEVPKS